MEDEKNYRVNEPGMNIVRVVMGAMVGAGFNIFYDETSSPTQVALDSLTVVTGVSLFDKYVYKYSTADSINNGLAYGVGLVIGNTGYPLTKLYQLT